MHFSMIVRLPGKIPFAELGEALDSEMGGYEEWDGWHLGGRYSGSLKVSGDAEVVSRAAVHDTARIKDLAETPKCYAYLDTEACEYNRPPRSMVFLSKEDADKVQEERDQDFTEWLNGGNQDDWIVLVDCHA